MDILYLVGDKSLCSFLDLRFSLRSIEKYGKNVDRVFMCGHIPDFISDEIIKIPTILNPAHCMYDKNYNMTCDLIYAIDNSDIGINHDGEFIISMDDHFIFGDVDFDNYPYYIKDYNSRKCRHMLPKKIEDSVNSQQYQMLLIKTQKYCELNNLPWYNFTLHRNMHISRKTVELLRKNFDDILNYSIPVEPFALINNATYKYNQNIKTEIVKDNKHVNAKLLKTQIEDGIIFYSSNDVLPTSDLFTVLKEQFPNKSKYEITDI